MIRSEDICTKHNTLKEVLLADWVPPSLLPHRGLARLVICEDNQAVIKSLLNYGHKIDYSRPPVHNFSRPPQHVHVPKGVP